MIMTEILIFINIFVTGTSLGIFYSKLVERIKALEVELQNLKEYGKYKNLR